MKSWWILIFILACPLALACDTPLDGKAYTSSQDFCSKNYYLPNGIIIDADSITIDCNNAVLQGDFKGTGVLIRNSRNTELRNCHIVNYNYGIHLLNSTGSEIHDNSILRNYIGLRLEESSQNKLYENRDVSIKSPIRSVSSAGNHIRYTNKNLEGDFCRHNSCNEYTPARKIEQALFTFQQGTLAEILQKAVMQWITGTDTHSQQ